jgi:hypothetical protein
MTIQDSKFELILLYKTQKILYKYVNIWVNLAEGKSSREWTWDVWICVKTFIQ